MVGIANSVSYGISADKAEDFATSVESGSRYNPLNIYLSEVGRFPRLTADDEVELATRIRQGDGQASKRLLEANLRLVVSIAKKYGGLGVPLLDLIQEGNLGLMKAIKKYDHTKGNRFPTYATWWVKQEIMRAIANQSHPIHLPSYVLSRVSRIKKARERFLIRHERMPYPEELAKELSLSTDTVKECLIMSQGILSLEAPINDDESSVLGDTVPVDAPTPVEEGAYNFIRQRLSEVLSTLTDREEKVLRMRFGLVDGKQYTLAEVGKKFSVSGERIRQIEVRALEKLRQPSRFTRLDGLLDGM